MSTRGFKITKAHRELRRKQAEERFAAYDQLSLQEKLERLPADGAKKQRARLEAAIAKTSQHKQVSTLAKEAIEQNNNKNKKEGR
jgi:hypothetical protein